MIIGYFLLKIWKRYNFEYKKYLLEKKVILAHAQGGNVILVVKIFKYDEKESHRIQGLLGKYLN